jgi:hypothetical protein
MQIISLELQQKYLLELFSSDLLQLISSFNVISPLLSYDSWDAGPLFSTTHGRQN